jgi:DNA-binding transcriptional ArsR family regulator
MSDGKSPGENFPDASDELPYTAREIDASAMKAFAHPLRMRMYEYLNDHDAATATMLARHTGESTGQTSYHLRQLQRHGFVEEDTERGTGRERWWKAVGFNMRGQVLAQDSTLRPAVALTLQRVVNERGEALQSWYERSEREDTAWVEATVNSKVTARMTREESRRLVHDLMTVIHERTEEAKARREAEGGEGERLVRLYLDVFPLPEDD